MEIAPTGDILDQPPGGMSWIQGKLADHIGNHVVLSPEEAVLLTSPGTESSYPRPLQSLNNSTDGVHCRESTGTGPVIVEVAPVTSAAFSGITTNQFLCVSLFPHPLLLLVCRARV